MDKEKLQQVAQSEIAHHRGEVTRLTGLIDQLMTDLGYHERQIRTWEMQLGDLALEETVELPALDDGFVERRLTLIQGGGGELPDPAA